MALKNVQPTQVTIKDMKVVDFFDNTFVGIMKKHMPEYNFLTFGIFTLNEKCESEDRIILFQKIKEDFDKNIIGVDAKDSEALNKILKVIEEYYKEK